MFVTIKTEGNALLIVISCSLIEENKILLSFNLHMNENYYENIITTQLKFKVVSRLN